MLKLCIFCGIDLVKYSKLRSHEHVIPKFIHGSLQIQDVCNSCNSNFGDEVDHLILRDGRVINVINQLNLPELKAAIINAGRTVGTDIIDGTERQFQIRDEKLSIINGNKEIDLTEVDEHESMGVLVKKLVRDKRLNFNRKSAVKYVDEQVRPKYFDLEFGQSLKLSDVGYTLKRGSSTDFKTIPKWEPNAANRLIAKIIVEIAFYTIPRELLSICFKDLKVFAGIAMGTIKNQDWRIMLRTDNENRDPNYNHLIQVLFYPNRMIAIDIDLFDCVNYRGVLIPEGEYTQPNYEGKVLEGIGIGMSFYPECAHEKRIAFRYGAGKDGWEEHIITDL